MTTIEAHAWIREPISALSLFELLDRSFCFATVAYHVLRLVEAGLLVEHGVDSSRGPREHLYKLAG